MVDQDAENDCAKLLGGPVADEGELLDILAGALAESGACQSSTRSQLLKLIARHKGGGVEAETLVRWRSSCQTFLHFSEENR